MAVDSGELPVSKQEEREQGPEEEAKRARAGSSKPVRQELGTGFVHTNSV